MTKMTNSFNMFQYSDVVTLHLKSSRKEGYWSPAELVLLATWSAMKMAASEGPLLHTCAGDAETAKPQQALHSAVLLCIGSLLVSIKHFLSASSVSAPGS